MMPALAEQAVVVRSGGPEVRVLARSNSVLASEFARVGAQPQTTTFAPPQKLSTLEASVKLALLAVDSDSVRSQVFELLKRLSPLINRNPSLGSRLPMVHARFLEDGSFAVEWRFKDRRLMFSIDPIANESGWTHVSRNGASLSAVSGDLGDLRPAIALLQME